MALYCCYSRSGQGGNYKKMTQEELVNKWKEKAQDLQGMSEEEQRKWLAFHKYEIFDDCMTCAIENEIEDTMTSLVDFKSIVQLKH